MSSFNQNHYTLVLFLVLTLWTSHIMCHRLISSEEHEKWMAQYGKVYKDDDEKEKRFQIFKNNVEFIESFNAAGDKLFNLGINQFADLHNEEFKALVASGNKRRIHSMGTATKTWFRYENVTKIPATMDWRERGAVTPVKAQRGCGSCWAFATVATIEGIHQITTGKMVTLSAQEIVDCVKGESEGCIGGYVDEALAFVVKKGIASEAYYPYKAEERECKTKKLTHIAARIKDYERVPPNDEKALLKAVANQPVLVTIDAGGHAFQFYKSGVLTGKCGTQRDHAVTVVGYGKLHGRGANSTKYWLVKNSWGTIWGEKGYIKMQRDIHSKEGLCGIAAESYYAVA